MQRYLSISLVILFAILPFGCADELSDRYQSPNKGSVPTIGEFFTSIINNDRIRPSYWEISTFINWHVGVYTQSVGYVNGQAMYQQNESYIQSRWNDYYRPDANGAGVMAVFREIEQAYGRLSDKERKEAEVFLQAAKVIFYDQTAQMVDLWGDIPFNEAGSLNSKGEIVYAKFDPAEDIYSTITEDLKSISAYFATASLSTPAQTLFSKQDILLAGNLDKWRRYTNSLRLRLLMRLSFVEEDKSKQEVQQLLLNESQFPLINTTSYVPGRDDILLAPLTTYSDDLHQAFTDWTNYTAPYFALEQVLKPAGDLRIPVLYDKYGESKNGGFTPNAEFKAMPLTLSTQENLERYSILDSSTLLFNNKLPGILFTASEVNFLKAEAFERWGFGDAQQEYKRGIKNSINFYFYLNGLNPVTPHSEIAPTDHAIDEFLANASSIQYSGSPSDKLHNIWIQKWVHFGVLQSIQSWAEMRRTGSPQLSFNPATLNGYELPPSRLTYPDNEKTYNKNYSAVASQDLRTNTIFWDIR